MKATLLILILAGSISGAAAQEALAPDQNPAYAVSRARYMGISDSLTRMHSTTVHDTYKAYDWYEAREERRRESKQFRRDLRMERTKRPYYYDRGYDPYYNGYPNRYNYRGYRPWWW
jgi:hypothetical protein